MGGKAKHLVLLGPCGGQVGEAGNAHAMGKSTVNRRFDEIGREERERDRHIDLSNAPATISASQCRPRAIAAMSVARVSARIGRRSCADKEAGTMISRRRFIGVFFHGMRTTGRSLSTRLGG